MNIEREKTFSLVMVNTSFRAGARGFISFWALMVLLVAVVVGGVIFYRLFSTDAHVQIALSDSQAAHKEPVRYKIPSPPPPPAVPVGDPSKETEPDGEAQTAPADSDPIQALEPDGAERLAVKNQIGEAPLASSDTGKDAAAVSEIQPDTLYTKVPAGRVRTAPSTDSKIIFYLKKGDKVSVIDTRNGWYLIGNKDDQKGWAHGMLFSMDAPGHPGMVDDNLIRAILVESPGPARRTVHIMLNDYHLPKIIILKGDRPRVVCDFFGLHLSPEMKKKTEYETGFIRAVRVGIHPGLKPKIRIVVDLVPEHDYIVEQKFILEENVFLLDIRLK